MNNHRKVLITGGLGYVGAKVAQVLSTRSDLEIVLGSRRAQEPPDWLPRARVIAMDWCSQQSLLDVCNGVDIVLHLAAMNDAGCLRDPVAALEINGVNTGRMVEAAKTRKVGKFIYVSTAHIYGAPLAGKIDELVLPCARHPYASSHRAAEDVVLAAANQMTPLVLRLSNSFGAPAHPEANCWMLLVNDLCKQAVTAQRLVLRSAGLQRRDFVTLSDVGRAFSHVIDMPEEKVGDGIFNLGGSWSPRVIDVAELVQHRCSAVLGFCPEIVCPSSSANEIILELDYRIDKLLETGFVLTGNPIREIDVLLRFCHNTWHMKT